MRFQKTPLIDSLLIIPEPAIDGRGLFARTYCHKTFLAKGLHAQYPQCNTSYNEKKGTLRGLHYQKEPFMEPKIIRCTAGQIFDVIVDLRKNSKTYLKWHGTELTAENRYALYVPAGFAHGFLTLSDKSEVFYMIGEEYHPEATAGIRWNDPALGIKWVAPVKMVSARDNSFPNISL